MLSASGKWRDPDDGDVVTVPQRMNRLNSSCLMTCSPYPAMSVSMGKKGNVYRILLMPKRTMSRTSQLMIAYRASRFRSATTREAAADTVMNGWTWKRNVE
jgi:hypothetical protein